MKPPEPANGKRKTGKNVARLAKAAPKAVGAGWLASTTEFILAVWPGSGTFRQRLNDAMWHTPMKAVYALLPAATHRLGGDTSGPDAGDKASFKARRKLLEAVAKKFTIIDSPTTSNG